MAGAFCGIKREFLTDLKEKKMNKEIIEKYNLDSPAVIIEGLLDIIKNNIDPMRWSDSVTANVMLAEKLAAKLTTEPTEEEIERVAEKLTHLEGEYINDHNHIKEIAKAAIKAVREL